MESGVLGSSDFTCVLDLGLCLDASSSPPPPAPIMTTRYLQALANVYGGQN